MNTFKNRLKCNIIYFLSWIGYFFIARLLFLAYYYKKTSNIGFLESLQTFSNGLKLDSSFTGYLSAIPFLLFFLSVFIPKNLIKSALKIYTFAIVFIITFWFLVDVNMYKFWGNRLDSTILIHAKTPKIMLASVSGWQLFGGLSLWIILSLLFCFGFNKIINKITQNLAKGKLWELPVFLLIFGSLIIPIRGGFQTIPINQSNVYFSNKMFANHAAVNFAWNFSNTLVHKPEGKNDYKVYNNSTVKNILNSRIQPLKTAVQDSILNTSKPNVLLIIWESLSAKAVGALNGSFDATPNLGKLAKEGILFTNFYANGDRTDKGIPAILSGFYPQPKSSIIKMVTKSNKLPMLSSEMKKLGYYNSFYYGGDMNFGNMNTYIRNGNIDKIVSGDEFDKANWNSKWGAFDHIVFNRLQENINTQKQPFFTTLLTLTSHEPYELPKGYAFKFGKKGEQNKYLSSQAYTDEAIGNFITEAKKTTWWKNTLVIILPDHGHPLPKHKGDFNDPIRFKIPMLWLGGALHEKGKIVDNFGSQIDLSYTLLSLLNANTSDFIFGKNLFNTSEKQYAHYIFNNGFGIIDKNGTFVYDYTGKKTIVKKGKFSKLDSLGKAITQNAYQHFLDK